MTVKEYLNRPFEINRLIKARTTQLQGIKNLIAGTSVAYDLTPHSGSPDIHKLESLMAQALDLEKDINELSASLGKTVAEVASSINAINRPDCEQVLTARYICFKDWTTIAHEMEFSRDWIFRLHRKGIALIKLD